MRNVDLWDVIDERHYDVYVGEDGKKHRKWTPWERIFECKRKDDGYNRQLEFMNSIVKKPRHLYYPHCELRLNI